MSDGATSPKDVLRNLWREFRKAPTWVQAVIGLAVLFVVIGLASGGSDEDGETTTAARSTAQAARTSTAPTVETKTASTATRATTSTPARNKQSSAPRVQYINPRGKDCLESLGYRVKVDRSTARVTTPNGRLVATTDTFPTAARARAFDGQLGPSGHLAAGRTVMVLNAGNSSSEDNVIASCVRRG